ncbi:LysR substrate-binding domain-containing protein [Pelagibacterium sp. H642]|uniref:LysR substrate-binding domain-containing protein n=1 Tax=Pelagibacterium sp. H642 TaxID=1881069 RepID=UPI0028166106|nr:LysR substrate-binding domain-containing protein [Pelagibacterium sp. H642]WMT91884.1 LysR substrate-binding domain-containing protein [Pelagibacterium sp. H642]
MLNNVSLSALKAFEAAGRLGSFRDAAAELNLSSSAVSHAIYGLEKSLGVSLFERQHRSVHLTQDGRILMRHATAAFAELRSGLERVTSLRQGLLRIHCAPSFATQVISPRLPSFLQDHPDIEVKIAASTDYTRFPDGEFDADIVYGAPRGEGVAIVPLGEERLTPLCRPEIAARIREPEDLRKHTLIRSDLKRFQWSDWFEQNNILHPPSPGMSFDRSFMAIAAAANGLGIALESTRLADPELRRGALVTPLFARHQSISYTGHFLVYPKVGAQRQLVRRFSEWLLDQLRQLDSCLEKLTSL